MTLLEVYEGTSKDVQVGDEIYWDHAFRKVESVAPCDACHLPCTRVFLRMPPDSRHRGSWVWKLAYDPYERILLKKGVAR